MRLDDKIRDDLKGFIDLVNSSRNKYVGAMEAAKFWKYFVEERPKRENIDFVGVFNDIDFNMGRLINLWKVDLVLENFWIILMSLIK